MFSISFIDNDAPPSLMSGKGSQELMVYGNMNPCLSNTWTDKVQINKINEVQTLFPDKVLVPKIEPGDSCGCGFVWLEPTLGDCEGTNIHIHHSKITSDSRSSSLILLYRKTGLCNCKLTYSGEQDKLLRVSALFINIIKFTNNYSIWSIIIVTCWCHLISGFIFFYSKFIAIITQLYTHVL